MSKPRQDRDVEVPADIIQQLLTESEWKMVKQRMVVARLLKSGKSIRDVASRAGVGTDTVVRVAKKLRESQPLKEYFSSEPKPQQSKWLFGTSRSTED
jgi:Trp operon repressor